jgi:hypothetical protein
LDTLIDMTTKKQFIEDYTNNRESLGMLESLSKLYDKYVGVDSPKVIRNYPILRIVRLPIYPPEEENADRAILYNGMEVMKLSRQFWDQAKRDKKTYNFILEELINVHRIANKKPKQ